MKMFHLSIRILAFLVLWTLVLQVGAQTPRQAVPNSQYVFDLPIARGEATQVFTESLQSPNLIRYQLTFASTINDSTKKILPAPEEGRIIEITTLAKSPGGSYCDSIPPPCGPNEYQSIVIDFGGELGILWGLEPGSTQNAGISVGSWVQKGQILGEYADELHFEVYVPLTSTATILQANGYPVRNWVQGRQGRTIYKYDTHNRIPQFCIQNQTREIRDGEILSGGACSQYHASNKTVMPGSSLSATVYPQPASEIVYLRVENPLPGAVELYVFDMQGKRVHQALSDPGKQNPIFTVSNLNNGLYFYQIKAHGEAFTGKLLMTK